MRYINEDYAKTQSCRKKDFYVIKKSNRKVMTIHLGGIYLECLLKGIIIKKNDIIKSEIVCIPNGSRTDKYICWYNSNAIDKINRIPNYTKNDLLVYCTAQNPEHNLNMAIKQIDELNNGIPSDILRIIQYLNRPLRNSYIDFRYMSDDKISDLEYERWEESYISFIKYFNKMKKTFPFNI